jgi:hypothetical protein
MDVRSVVANDPKLIKLEHAKDLLADGTFVHVFRPDGNVLEEFYWPKEKVLKFMGEFGCELSGPEARKAQHGLCSRDASGRYHYFQHKGEGPKDG